MVWDRRRLREAGRSSGSRRRSRPPFLFVSVHTPSKDLSGDERAHVETLRRAPAWIDVHPNTISAPPYMTLGWRLVLENMDRRKERGQVADDLAALFVDLPGGRAVS